MRHLNQGYEAGIRNYQLWDTSHPCAQLGQQKDKLRVCGDYSVTVNPHRKFIAFQCPAQTISYANSVGAPDSQKQLALSTGRPATNLVTLWDKLSTRLFPRLTNDLKEVAVYIDTILVSDITVERHLPTLKSVLQCLQDKGLQGSRHKCLLAKHSAEYLDYTISKDGITNGQRVNAIT